MSKKVTRPEFRRPRLYCLGWFGVQALGLDCLSSKNPSAKKEASKHMRCENDAAPSSAALLRGIQAGHLVGFGDGLQTHGPVLSPAAGVANTDTMGSPFSGCRSYRLLRTDAASTDL